MAKIRQLKDKNDEVFYPQTHTKAVVDSNGYTAESRLQAMQDEINQAQLAVGAVPSDLTPTENSTNWVTSGGVFNVIQVLSNAIADFFINVNENGFYFVDTNMNIGAYFDNDGFHAINMLEYTKV